MSDDAHQLTVGILAPEGQPAEVVIDLGIACRFVSFPPEFAIHFAQTLVKNARLAGFTGEFVELPVEFSHPIH